MTESQPTSSPVQPVGLSTAWNGPHTSLDALLDEHRALGFTRLEAYAHFTPAQIEDLAARARDRGVEIASLHSPCPVPVNQLGMADRWGDWLASTNATDRTYAVEAVKRTVDTAAAVGARAIVIHLGNTGVISRQRELFDVVAREGRGSDAHRRLLDEARREREARKGPCLEAALTSIRALGEHALGTGVRLGVEARDGYHEIPSVDELADVFAACDGLPVGYWHDAGHGAKLEYLGYVEHEDYLRRWGDRLVGMHVHDTHLGRDHLAPGLGETDFTMLSRYLRPDTVRTLELARSNTVDQIRLALDLLAEIGGFGIREGILIEA